MDPPLFGSEIEYCTIIKKHGKRHLTFWVNTGEGSNMLGEWMPEGLFIPGIAAGFLQNGARLYIDTGNHPEYATPEATRSRDIVRYERAGERIVEHTIKCANEAMRDQGIIIRAFKNNIASAEDTQKKAITVGAFGVQTGVKTETEVSYGAHESYLARRYGHNMTVAKIMNFLRLFFASRQLFTGNGILDVDYKKDRLRFALSQRVRATESDIDAGTTARRPFFNTLDEPHADAGIYRRLHIIGGDANMAEIAIALKFGTTALLLDMVEQEFLKSPPFNPEPEKNHFVQILREFSLDSSLSHKKKIDGVNHTITAVQEVFYNLACAFVRQPGRMNSEREFILSWWGKVIEYAKLPNPHIMLAPLTDWAAKKYLLEEELGNHGLDWSASPRTAIKLKVAGRVRTVLLGEHLKRLDYLYHEISPRGLARRLYAKNFFERVVTDEEIDSVVLHPILSGEPGATRAAWRAAELQWSVRNGLELTEVDFEGSPYRTDWEVVVTKGRGVQKNLNPYESCREAPH